MNAAQRSMLQAAQSRGWVSVYYKYKAQEATATLLEKQGYLTFTSYNGLNNTFKITEKGVAALATDALKNTSKYDGSKGSLRCKCGGIVGTQLDGQLACTVCEAVQ